MSSNYRVRTTTSTDDTRVTATATSGANQTSYNIEKVTQLASAARVVNTTDAGRISGGTKIDASGGLYASQGTFSKFDTVTWNPGSVESQTVTLTKGSKTANLVLDSAHSQTVLNTEKMNVKVNGKSYVAIDSGVPTAGQVLVGTDGKLTFADVISSTTDLNVEVDFVANKEVENFTFSGEPATVQLTKGPIDASTFKMTFTKNGTPQVFTLTGANITDGTTTLGTIDSTGKISWLDGTSFINNTNVAIEYTPKFFSFNLQSSTSKGDVSENFLIQGSDSLNNVIDKVNKSDVGLSMLYDSFSDKVTLTRTETGDFNTAGAGNEITMTGAFLADTLKLGGVAETGGQNAIFTINGLDTERNSNTFSMNGVSFTLKQTFNNADNPTNDPNINNDPPVSVSINNDSSKVFDNIKDFITKYNDLIDKIQAKTSEERYRSYTPLTDTQREQLSDKQQEQWEEKAKSGLLRRDSILTNLLSNMRSNFYTTVNNTEVSSSYNQLTKIGITTTNVYQNGGKLQIDDTKLKAAIEADPSSVEKLFNATGSNGQRGIAQLLYDTVNNTMGQLKEQSGRFII